jgi:hypothetical protein
MATGEDSNKSSNSIVSSTTILWHAKAKDALVENPSLGVIIKSFKIKVIKFKILQFMY